ncbi:tetratricopeptide repeat protein [Alsobacter sp. R-9]
MRLPPLLLALSAAAAMLPLGPPGAMAQEDRAWEECKRNPEPDWVIFNCTAVIDGGMPRSNTRKARAHVLRAGAYERKKTIETARADLNRAVELAKANADILMARAEFRIRQGELEAATEDVEAAFAVAPNAARVWFGRATIARQRGDIAGAVAALDKVIALDPRYPRARTLRGELGSATPATPGTARTGS